MAIMLLDPLDEFPKSKTLINSEIAWSLSDPEGSLEFRFKNQDLNDEEELSDSGIVFSYKPKEIEKFLLSNSSGWKSFYEITSESDFKTKYEEFKASNRDIILPRLRISSGKEIDVLDLADLFKLTDTKTLKYINGAKGSPPALIKYEGMSTFEDIQNLRGGVLVPAREMDIVNYKGDSSSLNTNQTFIIQYLAGGDYISLFRYTVKTNSEYGLVWTDITELNLETVGDITEVLNNLTLEDSLTNLTFYLEIECHKDKFYISKIFQGIHPYYSFKSNKNV